MRRRWRDSLSIESRLGGDLESGQESGAVQRGQWRGNKSGVEVNQWRLDSKGGLDDVISLRDIP